MVISIVATLIALLMPAVKRARIAARQVVCLNQLHHIGMTMQMYAGDYDGRVPRGNDVIWFKAFLTQLPGGADHVESYLCPEFPDADQLVCYVVNAWTFDSLDDQVGYEVNEPTPLDDFDHPSETIYLADNEDGWWRTVITSMDFAEPDRNDVWHFDHMANSLVEDVTYGRRVSRDRHGAGPNVLYVDGHTTFMKADAMTLDQWRTKWQ